MIAAAVAPTHEYIRRRSTPTVSIRAVSAALMTLLFVPQMILWRFLGLPTPLTVLGAAGIVGMIWATRGWADERIDVGTLASLGALALLLCVLAGEGRFFYANADWQVRDAVLRDLVTYPWPWAYDVRAAPDVLRAPLAMYLLPALAGKAGGLRVAELVLLAQNAAILTGLLAIGAGLFADRRRRLIALVVVLAFSGLDIVGAWLTGLPLDGHLEWWSVPQFSSNVTLLFWVPQHAFAGWCGALLYLRWREGRLPLAGLLAPLPLLALWSPLPLIGMLPFAAQAGIATLRRRGLVFADVALPAAATLLATPGLLYMTAGSGAVGGHPAALPFGYWAAFEFLEVGVFLAAAIAVGHHARFAGAALAITAVTLLVAPFLEVGEGVNFSGRATIPALTILALQMADLLGATDVSRAWRRAVIVALLIGAATPLSEIRHALVLPTSPVPRCSYFGVVPHGASTYVAPLSSLPTVIRPALPALIRPANPPRCWDRPWPMADQYGQR